MKYPGLVQQHFKKKKKKKRMNYGTDMLEYFLATYSCLRELFWRINYFGEFLSAKNLTLEWFMS